MDPSPPAQSDSGSTVPAPAPATAEAAAAAVRDACLHRCPSRSQSASSNLPSMRERAAKSLAAMLGRRTLELRPTGAQADALPPAAAAAAAAAAESSPAARRAAAGVYELGPASFRQIRHSSLLIDATWTDLLCAYRAALTAEDSPASRRAAQEEIARVFRAAPNVFDTREQVEAADVRAHLPPCTATPAASSPSSSSSSLTAVASPINVNSTLPRRFVSPHYLRAEHNILTCLSARSCLDTWLRVMDFLPGSRVLLSAINIPDISVVLRAHKLVPVPVDIHLDTLAPRLDLLADACARGTAPSRAASSPSSFPASPAAPAASSSSSPSPPPPSGRVVAILVAHLYGRRFDMDPIVSLARQYGVRLVEDQAESYSGREYIGHPASDLTLLSFGSIKMGTAFGGGICRVRDRATYDQMVALQRSLPVQSRSTFFSKCSKGSLAMLMLNVPTIGGATFALGRALRWDYKATVVGMMRGFPGAELMGRLREQPGAPLLTTLARRVRLFDPARFQAHQDRVDLLLDLLPSAPGCVVPGVAAPVRNHWLCPVMLQGDAVAPGTGVGTGAGAGRVAEAQRELNDNGVDAYRGATQLSMVPMPPEESASCAGSASGPLPLVPPPLVAEELMARTLYLPMHGAVGVDDIVRMAAVMHRVVEKMEARYGKGATTTTAPGADAGGAIQSKL